MQYVIIKQMLLIYYSIYIAYRSKLVSTKTTIRIPTVVYLIFIHLMFRLFLDMYSRTEILHDHIIGYFSHTERMRRINTEKEARTRHVKNIYSFNIFLSMTYDFICRH